MDELTTSCPVIDVVGLNRSPSPWDEIRQALSVGPVARSEAFGGFWTVMGYAEVRDAALDVASVSSAQGATIPRLGAGVPALPAELDPPDHVAYRKVLIPALRPERVQRLEPVVRQLAASMIEEFRGRDEVDLVTDLARRIPPRVIADVLGLPPEHTRQLVELSHGIDRAAAAQDPAANRTAAVNLIGYIDQIVGEARGQEGDSLLVQIANAVVDGSPIQQDSAVGMLLTLILAGHSTTINGIGNTLWLLDRIPGLKDRLLADRTLVPAAIEESLRLESPIPMMGRTAACPVRIGGVDIAEGDRIGLMWGAANHDERRFEDPDEFRLDRGRNPHMAFGHGVHRCVGEHLARMEMRVVVEEVLDRIPDYRVHGDVVFGGPGLPTQNRGLASLPVTLRPGT